MVPLAPRYDDRLVEAIRALDDPTVPMAEVCRRVGRAAERLGVVRPSYVHVRRFLVAERARREAERLRHEAIRRIVVDVAEDLVLGLRVDAYEVADRVREARSIGSEPRAP